MSAEFHTLEESLKEFLTESQNDNYNARNTNFHKYNNLKIFMSPGLNKTPHFIVRIGISEAMYDMSSGERLSGGLGADERLIRRWLDKGSTRSKLTTAWGQSQKAKTVSMRDDIDDD